MLTVRNVDKFRLDVEKAQQESHVLSPAYYEDGQRFDSGDTMKMEVESRHVCEKLGRYSHTGKGQVEDFTSGMDARKMWLESQMQNLRHFSKLRR